MEQAFPFVETPDQRKAIDEVKVDMERAYPMDRLVCGDVGFGKTEVAIRAAFKAIQDGKQVAVLAPTTLLATQHGNTFADRFAGYPIRVETLSRRSVEGLARTASQRRSRLEHASGRLNPQTQRVRIARAAERLATLDVRASRALANRLVAWRRLLDGQGKLLTTLSYQSVLQRGFALVRDESGFAVRSASQVTMGARVEMEFADGRVEAEVTRTGSSTGDKGSGATGRTVPRPAPAPKPARRTGGGSGPQGSLF